MKAERKWQVAGSVPSLSKGRRLQVGAPPRGCPQVAPGRIELHIGELTLHGFDHVEPAQVGIAVQQELSRLLAENGPPASLSQAGSIAALEGEAFSVASGIDSGSIGVQIARAIYRGLKR